MRRVMVGRRRRRSARCYRHAAVILGGGRRSGRGDRYAGIPGREKKVEKYSVQIGLLVYKGYHTERYKEKNGRKKVKVIK